MYWLFRNLFFLDRYLAQPRYSREGLGPSSKQCALPSLRFATGSGGRVCGGNGRRGGSENLDWYFLKNLINFKNERNKIQFVVSSLIILGLLL